MGYVRRVAMTRTRLKGRTPGVEDRRPTCNTRPQEGPTLHPEAPTSLGRPHLLGETPPPVTAAAQNPVRGECCSGSYSRKPVCNAGNQGSILGSGRFPGGGHGNPLQYSCLENPMDREAWWATVHRVAQSRTRLSDYHLSNQA